MVKQKLYLLYHILKPGDNLLKVLFKLLGNTLLQLLGKFLLQLEWRQFLKLLTQQIPELRREHFPQMLGHGFQKLEEVFGMLRHHNFQCIMHHGHPYFTAHLHTLTIKLYNSAPFSSYDNFPASVSINKLRIFYLLQKQLSRYQRHSYHRRTPPYHHIHHSVRNIGIRSYADIVPPLRAVGKSYKEGLLLELCSQNINLILFRFILHILFGTVLHIGNKPPGGRAVEPLSNCSIKPHSCCTEEILIINPSCVNKLRFAVKNSLYRLLVTHWNPQMPCKSISGPNRHYGQSAGSSNHPFGNLIHRAVSTYSNNHIITFLSKFPCRTGGISHTFCSIEISLPSGIFFQHHLNIPKNLFLSSSSRYGVQYECHFSHTCKYTSNYLLL